jgi:hypothetical protein
MRRPPFHEEAPRSGPQPVPETRLPVREFVRSTGLQSVVLGPSKDPNAKVTVLLVSPGSRRPVLAVKLPMTARAADAVTGEAWVLRRLGAVRAPILLETIPRVVDIVDFEGRPAVVVTALPGMPMATTYLRWRHTASRSSVTADFAAVGAWLGAVQAQTAGRDAPVDMDGGVAQRLRERFDGRTPVADDVGALDEVCGRLGGCTAARTVVHGDLWVGNVLLHGPRVSGVVDWEAAAVSGEPVRDLARFALMYALYLDRHTRGGRRVAGHAGLRAAAWGGGVEYALDGTGWFPELFRRFLQEGLERLGASPDRWRDAAVAGIAEAAAHTDDEGFARNQLELYRRLVPRQGRC